MIRKPKVFINNGPLCRSVMSTIGSLVQMQNELDLIHNNKKYLEEMIF